MSRTLSPSSGRPYGLARVCRVWRAARASVYRHLSSSGPNRRGVLARLGESILGFCDARGSGLTLM